MRLDELFLAEGPTERVPFTTYIGEEIDLYLTWDPTPQQARQLIDRAKEKRMRVLVVRDRIVCWDAYHVEHRDVAELFDQIPSGREGKLWMMLDDDNGRLEVPVYRIGGGSWHGRRDQYLRVPPIARLLAGGFAEPQPYS